MRPLAARLTELTSWWQLHSAAVWSMNTMGGLFLHFAPLRVFCFCICNNICNESSVWIFMHFLKLNYSMKVNMQRRNLHRYSYPHTDYHICISLIMTKISFMSHSLYFARFLVCPECWRFPSAPDEFQKHVWVLCKLICTLHWILLISRQEKHETDMKMMYRKGA